VSRSSQEDDALMNGADPSTEFRSLDMYSKSIDFSYRCCCCSARIQLEPRGRHIKHSYRLAASALALSLLFMPMSGLQRCGPSDRSRIQAHTSCSSMSSTIVCADKKKV